MSPDVAAVISILTAITQQGPGRLQKPGEKTADRQLFLGSDMSEQDREQAGGESDTVMSAPIRTRGSEKAIPWKCMMFAPNFETFR